MQSTIIGDIKKQNVPLSNSDLKIHTPLTASTGMFTYLSIYQCSKPVWQSWYHTYAGSTDTSLAKITQHLPMLQPSKWIDIPYHMLPRWRPNMDVSGLLVSTILMDRSDQHGLSPGDMPWTVLHVQKCHHNDITCKRLLHARTPRRWHWKASLGHFSKLGLHPP